MRKILIAIVGLMMVGIWGEKVGAISVPEQPILDKNQHFMVSKIRMSLKDDLMDSEVWVKFKRERTMEEKEVHYIGIGWGANLGLDSDRIKSLAGADMHSNIVRVFEGQFGGTYWPQIDFLNGLPVKVNDYTPLYVDLRHNLTRKLFYSIGYITFDGQSFYRYGEVDYSDCFKNLKVGAKVLECRAKFDENERFLGYEAYLDGVKAEEAISAEELAASEKEKERIMENIKKEKKQLEEEARIEKERLEREIWFRKGEKSVFLRLANVERVKNQEINKEKEKNLDLEKEREKLKYEIKLAREKEDELKREIGKLEGEIEVPKLGEKNNWWMVVVVMAVGGVTILCLLFGGRKIIKE